MFVSEIYSIQDLYKYISSTTVSSSSSKITISKIADYTQDFKLSCIYKRTVSSNNGTGIGLSKVLLDNATAPSNITDIYLGGWATTKGIGYNNNGTWNGNNRTSGALTQNTEYNLEISVQNGSLTGKINGGSSYSQTISLPFSITDFYIAFVVTDSTVQFTDVKMELL